MKRTLIAICAAAFMIATMTSTPASAFFIVAMVMESKKDKNFKEVNPYAPKKAGKKKKM